MVKRGPDPKAQSSCFHEVLSYNVTDKGYCPF